MNVEQRIEQIKRSERRRPTIEKIAVWIIVGVIAFTIWHGLDQAAQQNRCEKRAAALPADQFVQAALKCH